MAVLWARFPPICPPAWAAPRASCLPAVEVRGLLSVELAVGSTTVLGGSETLEAIIDELSVLLVEVLMGHHVRGARVHLVTAHLHRPEWWLGDRS